MAARLLIVAKRHSMEAYVYSSLFVGHRCKCVALRMPLEKPTTAHNKSLMAKLHRRLREGCRRVFIRATATRRSKLFRKDSEAITRWRGRMTELVMFLTFSWSSTEIPGMRQAK